MDKDRAAVRRVLWHWGRSLEYLKRRTQELESYKELMAAVRESAGAAVPDGMPRRPGPGDPVQRAVLRLQALEREFERAVEAIVHDCGRTLERREAIDELVDRLPSDQRRVIELRYKLGAPDYRYIAMKMCFSQGHVKLLEAAAIDALTEHILVEAAE